MLRFAHSWIRTSLRVALTLSAAALAAPAFGQVIINEIMQNPAAVSDSAGEWFELHNAGTQAVDIDGWTIADNGFDSHVIASGGPLLVPAGGFIVLGNNADSGTNGGVAVGYSYGGSFFLANGDDELVLLDVGLNEIDRVEWDGGPAFPDPSGASMALADPALDNNSGANWCTSGSPFGAGDLGTPGSANDCVAALPELVINEIMQNPAAVADASGEWFELFNPTGAAIDIDGWVIADNDTDAHEIDNGGPLLVPAGGYLVLGINADAATNGGVAIDYAYGSTFFLGNGADELILMDAALNEIDRVEWDGGAAFPDPTGAAMALVSPAADNNVGSNWCVASTPFGAGDLGTPGAANDCLVELPELVINEIMQNPSAVSDSSGEWFELHNPTAGAVDIDGWTITDNDSDLHLIDNGGPLLVPAGGYLVLGNNADTATNGGVAVSYDYGGSFFLANGADELVLLDGFGAEIDRVEWDGGPVFPDPNGASMALVDPALDNTDGLNWCEAATLFGDGDRGTPGGANDCRPLLLINEIMQNPAAVSDGSGEWFELYNPAAEPIDINGWTVLDNDSDFHVIDNGGPLLVPAGGYLVLGNNADTGTNGGVGVAYRYDGIALANGADELVLLDSFGLEADRVEWDGGPAFPDPTGASMSLLSPGLDNNLGSSWCTSTPAFGAGDLGTPGAANDCLGVCGGPATPLHAIQGDGDASPLEGAVGVIVEAVVVGDFQQDGSEPGLGGFFLQEEDDQADGDPLTSEGLFVFDGGFGVDVAPGDLVRVQGVVTEFFGLTELNSVFGLAICASGQSVTPYEALLPRAAPDDWERTEGMLHSFPQELFVTGNFTQARFGEVDLSVDGPLDTPTNVVAPGAPAVALQAANDLRRIQLDDGSTVENPLSLPPYLGDGGTLRTGDSTTGLTAVLGYAFGSYELHPTQPVDFTRLNDRPDGAPELGPALATVAGFNVLNYFTTLDDGFNDVCGPAGNQECRGADSAEEFARQKDKLLAALSILDADVVGVIEIENAPGDGPIADLVDGLNDVAGPGSFAYLPTGAIGTDAIRVGLIYRPAAVTPLGSFAVLDSSIDPGFIDTLNRPSLAQTFRDNVGGEVFTVVVNHLKSKGSSCDAVGDPDIGDGQGNCSGVRTAAAEALADWLATDPTGSGDADFLIIGDLNAYAMEDPVVALESHGYVDLIEALVGSGWADGAYSFNFDAQSGYLDHALASAGLAPAVGSAAPWHINADEPRGLDYNDFNQPGLYSADEFRSSDHDAIVVALYPDDDEDGVWNGRDLCPGTAIPEAVPEVQLKPHHYALVDGDNRFDTTEPPGGSSASFDLFDTAGCSCEQIIASDGLGQGHAKFGCSIDAMWDWVSRTAQP